jgi:hypothetical protein
LPWKAKGVSREEWLCDLILARMASPEAKNKVVEFGSATGEMTQELLCCGFQVTALEGRKESQDAASKTAPEARRIICDLEVVEPKDVRQTFDLIVHVGVLYHLLGPIEHLMQLRRWGPRLLLDTHCTRGECPELHRERFDQPRAGFRSGSWWLPKMMIEGELRQRWDKVELIDDREERNGRRVTYWAED